MIYEVFMPALSSTMTEGKVVSWTKATGDKVEKGETVVIVESDKADMDVESFYEGFLATIIVGEGESAPVGSTIAYIAETEAEIATAEAQAKTSSQPATASASSTPTPVATAAVATNGNTAPVPTEAPKNGRTVVSPRARKLAKELKVDLSSLSGSGPNGRIIAADVESAAGKPITPPIPSALPTVAAPAPVATPVAPAAAPVIPVSTTAPVALSTLQQAVVRSMMASLEVPTFRVGYTITTDALDQLYKQLKPKGVTMTVLLAKAIALTLKKHPIVNSSFTPQGIQYHGAANISVAVAMDDGGLITPVLKHADQVDLYSLSRNWKDLVDRARAKQLQPDEYSTGTFTLSNLGMFGVDRFDAILPPGQGAILAIGASRPQMVATKEGFFGIRSQMQVNITCDHRMIYGAHAAAFLKDLAQLIETDPQSLTL